MTRRRRGTELEADILEAVRAEIAERGYAALTYEGIAAAAGTSKTVLYRRWDTKVEMAMAAMVDVAREVLTVPDTGSLAGDLQAILARMRVRLAELGPRTIRSLLADLPEGSTNAVIGLITSHVDDVMAPVLERARARGELGPHPLPPRAATLPFDLARHEIFITGCMSEETIDEIISVCVVPLWTTLTNTCESSAPETNTLESDTPQTNTHETNTHETDRNITSSRGMTQT